MKVKLNSNIHPNILSEITIMRENGGCGESLALITYWLIYMGKTAQCSEATLNVTILSFGSTKHIARDKKLIPLRRQLFWPDPQAGYYYINIVCHFLEAVLNAQIVLPEHVLAKAQIRSYKTRSQLYNISARRRKMKFNESQQIQLDLLFEFSNSNHHPPPHHHHHCHHHHQPE